MGPNTSSGQTAAQWLATVDEDLLTEVIRDYGEERFAKQIARALVAARKELPIATTQQLSQLVARAVRTREPGQNPATRTFQAIRIYLNQELDELAHVLPQCVDRLNAEGRLVVISFHSLEDRLVKTAMKAGKSASPDRPAFRPLDKKPIRPSEAEEATNPRSRSAKLRAGERV